MAKHPDGAGDDAFFGIGAFCRKGMRIACDLHAIDCGTHRALLEVAQQFRGGPLGEIFRAGCQRFMRQIAMLRRMAGGPIKGENYFRAEIESGRVGADQSARRTEFD